MPDVKVLKQSGAIEEFDSDKMISSLKSSGVPGKTAEDIVDKISPDLKPLTTSKELFRMVGRQCDVVSRMRYSLKNAIYALGPSGYPFEKYIARVMNEHGYKTEVGRTVQGLLKETSNLTQLLWLLFYILITGPLTEELGWRGYALPHLLERFNPFTASLILGVIWGVWHLPSFHVGGMVQKGMSLVIFVLYTPCLSILMTWVFQRSHGSVLSAVMIHFMANICTTILGVTLPTLGITLLMASIFILVFDKQFGWFQPQSFNRRALFVGEPK